MFLEQVFVLMQLLETDEDMDYKKQFGCKWIYEGKVPLEVFTIPERWI